MMKNYFVKYNFTHISSPLLHYHHLGLEVRRCTNMNSRILGQKIAQARMSGEPVVEKIEAAKECEMEAFAKCFYWSGTLKDAEVLHLYTSMVQHCGRCSEIVILQWQHARITEQAEDLGYMNPVLEIDVNRLKTATECKNQSEKLYHYTHAKTFHDSLIFNMFFHKCMMQYYMTDDMDSTYMFPEWEKLVVREEGKVRSNCTSKFKQSWDHVLQQVIRYGNQVDDLLQKVENRVRNEGTEDFFPSEDELRELKRLFAFEKKIKSSHAMKNLGVSRLSDDIFLPVQDFMAHCGWALKNLNTFFDYWNGSKKSMIRCGKSLAGWSLSSDGRNYVGGLSPSLLSIDANPGTVDKFRDTLLGNSKYLDNDVKDLLLADGLRWYKPFLKFLMTDPFTLYKSEEDVLAKHPFGAAITLACTSVGIEVSEIKKWAENVNLGWQKLNLPYIPYAAGINMKDIDIIKLPGDMTLEKMMTNLTLDKHDVVRKMVDVESAIQTANNKTVMTLTQEVQHLRADVQNQQNDIHSIKVLFGLLVSKPTEVKQVLDLLSSNPVEAKQLVELLSAKQTGQPTKEATPTSKPVTTYEGVSFDLHKQQMVKFSKQKKWGKYFYYWKSRNVEDSYRALEKKDDKNFALVPTMQKFVKSFIDVDVVSRLDQEPEEQDNNAHQEWKMLYYKSYDQAVQTIKVKMLQCEPVAPRTLMSENKNVTLSWFRSNRYATAKWMKDHQDDAVKRAYVESGMKEYLEIKERESSRKRNTSDMLDGDSDDTNNKQRKE